MAEGNGVTNPKTWAEAITKISTPTATATMTILALLALLGYLAFKGVPAVVELTRAIQANTDTVANTAQTLVTAQAKADDRQDKQLDQDASMIQQHGDIINLLKTYSIETDDLWADKKARDALQALRAH